MDYILQLFEAGKKEFADNEVILSSINASWAKIDKYYNLIEETPIYAAAVVLNPLFKWEYFEKVWAEYPHWISKAKEAVKDLWESKWFPCKYEDILNI